MLPTKVEPDEILKALIHPLVLMQITEHHSRNVVQVGPKKKIVGAILGNICNHRIEIVNSFPLSISEDDAGGALFSNHLISRMKQYSEVFPELQIIGAYVTGNTNYFDDEENTIFTEMKNVIQNEFASIDLESPVYIKFNVSNVGPSRNLPLFVYEGKRIGKPDFSYNAVNWEMFSEESERIGINHIMKLSVKDGKDEGGVSEKHKKNQLQALDMLRNQINVILEYIKKVENNEYEFDYNIHCQASALAQKLATIDRFRTEFKNSFENEEKDLLLFSLMPKLTTMLGNMSQIWSKVSSIRSEGLVDEAFHMKSQYKNTMRYQESRQMNRNKNFKPGEENFEDFIDDEEHELELGGPKRKIYAADSLGASSSSSRTNRRKVAPHIRRGDSRKSNNRPADAGPSTSNSNSSTQMNLEIEGQPSNAWGPEEFGGSYVPDVPHPSESSVLSEENIEEPH